MLNALAPEKETRLARKLHVCLRYWQHNQDLKHKLNYLLFYQINYIFDLRKPHKQKSNGV